MRYGTSPEQATEEETDLLVERLRRLMAEFYRINPHLEPLPVTVISDQGTVLEVRGGAHDR